MSFGPTADEVAWDIAQSTANAMRQQAISAHQLLNRVAALEAKVAELERRLDAGGQS